MDRIKHIFFLGIGGIGMSALARYFNNAQYVVSGYDKTLSPLTASLEKEGIDVTYVDDILNVLALTQVDKEEVLVVYTPAIPKDNSLLVYFRENGFILKKRSEVLGIVTSQTVNLSVAGTHGKTTTSCIVATILQHSNMRFSAFLGGISTNLKSNYYYQKKEGNHFSITEADEFDRSFLHLTPAYAIITSTDADHLDIYGRKEDLEESYTQFSELVKDEGHRFFAKGYAKNIAGVSYSASDDTADYYAMVESKDGNGTRFSIANNVGEKPIINLYLNIPGLYNLENSIGAALMVLRAGVSLDAVREGLANFKGIKRRFEYVVDNDEVIYIDDYAHHPSELKAIISSVRELYPKKKITAVFQPHLYSRTQDFMNQFAAELSLVDELMLVPIYPARELPIAGITSQAILSRVTLRSAVCIPKEDVLDRLMGSDVEVLLTLGAGDIDRLVPIIREYYVS